MKETQAVYVAVRPFVSTQAALFGYSLSAAPAPPLGDEGDTVNTESILPCSNMVFCLFFHYFLNLL